MQSDHGLLGQVETSYSISADADSVNLRGIQVFISGGNESGKSHSKEIAYSLPTEQWFHFAVSKVDSDPDSRTNRTTYTLYINFVSVGSVIHDESATFPDGVNTQMQFEGGNSIRIGLTTLTASNYYFDGYMDEPSLIYDYSFTTSELGVYLYENTKLPAVNYYNSWFLPDDILPAINIRHMFSPEFVRGLQAKILFEPLNFKIVVRSYDSRLTHILEMQIKRILMQNNINPTTSKYPDSGIKFIEFTYQNDPENEIFEGTRVYRRDINIKLIRQQHFR